MNNTHSSHFGIKIFIMSKYGTEQCDAVRYRTVQCDAVRYRTARCSTVQNSVMQYGTEQCDEVRYRTVQFIAFVFVYSDTYAYIQVSHYLIS